MNKVSGWWKVMAIIFAIGFLLMIGLMIYGLMISNAENTCVSYCYNKGYESFTYDYANDKCACYVGDKIVEITPILGR